MKAMRGIGALLLAVSCLAGCDRGGAEWGGTISDSSGVQVVQNPGEGNWTLQSQPEVTEEVRIGSEEGDPAYQFGQIVSIDVDAQGNIHVLDQQAAQVRVFDAQGKHVRTVGKPGGGPGELSPATMAVLAGGNDVVYVLDAMRQRIVALGPDGAEVGSSHVAIEKGIPIRMETYAGSLRRVRDDSPAAAPGGAQSQPRFIMQVRAMMLPGMTDTVPMRDRILARDPASEQADTLLELESGRTIQFGPGGMPTFRLFESEPVWTVLQDGRIAHGRNDSYRIELLSNDGRVERVITRSVERRPVTEEDRAAFRDLMRDAMERQLAGRGGQAAAMAQQMVQSTQFADYYPAYALMMGGPGGTLWVQRIRTADDAKREGGTFSAQDVGSAHWDVFDAEGRLLGMLTLPTKFQPMSVVGNHLYGVQRDDMDVQHVVRLRIDGLAS